MSGYHQCFQIKPNLFQRVISDDGIQIFAVTLKSSIRAVSGSFRNCHGWKIKPSKSCWSCSSMWGASATLSSYHRARQAISKSTKRLWYYAGHSTKYNTIVCTVWTLILGMVPNMIPQLGLVTSTKLCLICLHSTKCNIISWPWVFRAESCL